MMAFFNGGLPGPFGHSIYYPNCLLRNLCKAFDFNFALTTAAVAIELLLHAEMAGCLALYAGTVVVVAALYVALAVRGPLRDAAKA
jgi:hypothetical protein